jgi:hypothetical protein
MYLRKSRQDDPNETIEEVLAKHEAMLQEWAKRELGYNIPAENIYREVISGESLSERVEMCKVLSRLEDPRVAGVLVIEPQRLSRGDLMDCGRLISIFRYTKSLVATPMMIYDMENKMEQRFFQDELMRGRDYLEYTKEILSRGRTHAVLSKGCYIGSIPPYGYDKVKLGKDCTLTPNETEAEVVRMMFNWFVNDGITAGSIARKLNDMGIKPRYKEIWYESTVNQLLGNQHYIGKVVWNRRKAAVHIEDGVAVKKRQWANEGEYNVAEGIHPAIVDKEIFEKAQAKRYHAPRVPQKSKLTNPLAGILVCGVCGHSLIRHPYSHTEARYQCEYNRPICQRSVKVSQIMEAVITTLEQVELPALKAKLADGSGDAAAIQKRLLEKLQKQLDEYKAQEETQYELLETKKYTQELFDRRNAALREKMEQCELQIYETKRTMPDAVDYAERILTLEKCIEALKDDSESVQVQNRLLHEIIEKIVVTTRPAPKRTVEADLKVFLRL